MRPLIAIVCGTMLLVSWMPRLALAQDITPVPTSGVPNPSDCSADGRSAEEYLRLLGTEPGVDATPTVFEPPTGRAADEGEAAEVAAVIWQYLACGNAGDFLRVAGLLSDGYISRLTVFEGDVERAAFAKALDSKPVAMPEEFWAGLVGILDVQILDGGGAVALVQIHDPFFNDDIYVYFVFERNGVRLLIDQIEPQPTLPEIVKDAPEEPPFLWKADEEVSATPQKRIPALLSEAMKEYLCALRGWFC